MFQYHGGVTGQASGGVRDTKMILKQTKPQVELVSRLVSQPAK
jgi:hypothetical protein